MNNDIGRPGAQSEGTALPPPRLVGDMTTLTVADGVPSPGTAASVITMAGPLPPGAGQQPSLRAAILHVAAETLTITF